VAHVREAIRKDSQSGSCSSEAQICVFCAYLCVLRPITGLGTASEECILTYVRLNMQCVTACCPLASCHANHAAQKFAPIQAAAHALALNPLLRLGLPHTLVAAKAAVLSDIVGSHIVIHKNYSIAHKV